MQNFIVRPARLAAALALLASACAMPQRGATPAPAPSTEAPLPPAPWSAAPLRASEVPAAFIESWRAAPNRATCALLAPASLGAHATAAPRAATFSGGWGVAYDLPGQRSAFGVAGTGVEPSRDTYDGWPHRITWADGSTAGHGPEGTTGPNQLAYLQVAGQRCLYNVWSRISVEHLEQLLASLRFVRME